MISFKERYKPGQVLSLSDENDAIIAEAVVLNYDPTTDNWRPMGASKQLPPSPNHWHVAVNTLGATDWLPAAIWESRNGNAYFGAHFTLQQFNNETYGRPLIYSIEDLSLRVGALAANVYSIQE
jgi:hypothetical protein